MIKIALSNQILKYISAIDENRFRVSFLQLSASVANKLMKNAKKKSSYESIQMGLLALYYMGIDNPPHPEIWIHYFLHMMLLYSSKVCEISESSNEEEISANISYLEPKELLLHLLEHEKRIFTPIEIRKEIGVTNKTVINRRSSLAKNDFVVPILVNQRIRSYELSNLSLQKKKGSSRSLTTIFDNDYQGHSLHIKRSEVMAKCSIS